MKLETDEDHHVAAFLKGATYVSGLLLLAVVTYRGVVPYLWSSRSDFALLGAFAAALIGLLLLFALSIAAWRDVTRTAASPVQQPEPDTEKE